MIQDKTEPKFSKSRLRFPMLIALLCSWFVSEAQRFQMNGQIRHFGVNQLIISFYKNTLEAPIDYTIQTDSAGNFEFELELQQINYFDLHLGLNGLLGLVAEPGDSVRIEADAHTFYPSLVANGLGASKWAYYKDAAASLRDNEEHYFFKLLKEKPQQFSEAVNVEETKQMAVLDSNKEQLSELFFRLRRADILSKYNAYRIDFLKVGEQYADVFQTFELQSVAPELQLISQEFGPFVEELLAVYRQKNNIKEAETLFDDYNFVRYIFDKGFISKEICERLQAQKIYTDIDLNGITDENQTLFKNFSDFSSQNNILGILAHKFELSKAREKGVAAPSFTLIDYNNKKLNSKSVKGTNVLMVFWASWCKPCVKDLEYLPIINSHFKDRQKLEVLNFSIDNATDFLTVAEKAKQTGRGTRVDIEASFLKDFSVHTVPAYLLIDKNGNWLSSDLVAPSIEEGRALIKQLETILNE